MTVLKWLSGARAQDKTRQYYRGFRFFFLISINYAIQGKFVTWLVNSALNCAWKPISQSSLRDSCDIGFRVQYYAEFHRQVMNFPIKSSKLTKFLERGDVFALGDKKLHVLHFPRAVQPMTCLARQFFFVFATNFVNEKQSRESRGLVISLPASPLANSLAN